jgi:(p)ppGpp synthase/HD superfamily hydrolase
MSTLERAIEIAARAHAGVRDKGGEPYLLHPLRMVLRLSSPDERMAAALHDIVEDTPWTIEDLRAEGFPPTVIAAVDALTKRPGERRMDAARRAGADPIARRVKLADLDDNMNLGRIAQPTQQDLERIQEYREVKAFLEGLA